MFCPNCGKQISNDSQFCDGCGARVNNTTTNTPVTPVYVPTQTITPPTGNEARWPAVCGVMGILAFAALMFNIMYPFDLNDIRISIWTAIDILLAIAVPVLFLIHTRKIPILTAIPMILTFIVDIMFYFIYYSREFEIIIGESWFIVPRLFSLSVIILYVIQMLTRMRNPVLAILCIILSVSYLTYLLIYSLSYGGPNIYTLLNFLQNLFLSVAYIVAMFKAKKRRVQQYI